MFRFKNVQLIDDIGDILNQMPHIYLDTNVSVTSFKRTEYCIAGTQTRLSDLSKKRINVFPDRLDGSEQTFKDSD